MAQAQLVVRRCGELWFSDPELPPIKVRALMAAAECLPPGEALICLIQALCLAQTFYLHYLAAVISMSIASTLVRFSFLLSHYT